MPHAQPNYLSVNADGEVTGSFPGGVDILLSDTSTPVGGRAIRWIRQADGSVVATTHTYSPAAGAHRHTTEVGNINEPGPSTIEFLARTAPGPAGKTTRVDMWQRNILDLLPRHSFVRAIADSTQFATIINGDGGSEFAHTPPRFDAVNVEFTPANIEVMAGYVSSAGGLGWQTGGISTTARTAAGQYTITYRTARNFSVTLVTPYTGTGPAIGAQSHIVSTTVDGVITYDATGTGADNAFRFISIRFDITSN